MNQLVTVCVPTYNKAIYLKESLSSLLNQTFKDFKLIVVDDASCDNTENIVKSFSDPRLHYYRNPSRLGMAANWNKCVEFGLNEDSEYLALYHDDDIYNKRILERQVKFLNDNPKAGLVHTALYYQEEETGYSVLKQPYLKDCTISLIELLDDICKCHNYHITTPSVLARKDAYRKTGNFDLSFKICPDLDLWWRMLEYYDLGYISEPLLRVRIHSKQVSNSDLAKQNAIAQTETLMHLERVVEKMKSKDKNFNYKYYLSKIKKYCAIEILRITSKTIITSEKDLFRIGLEQAVELSPTFDIILGVIILKSLNNAAGRKILELILNTRRRVLSRKTKKTNTYFIGKL